MSPDRLLLGGALLALLSALVSLGFLVRARRRTRCWEAVLEAAARGDTSLEAAQRALAVLGATLGVEALYLLQEGRMLACWDSLGGTREEEARALLASGEPLGTDLVAVWLGKPSSAQIQAFRHQVQPLVPLLRALSAPAEDPRQGFLALAKVAAGVAHELNSPLAAILTDASRLKKSASDEGSARRADTIVQAVERCRTVVDKLLLYARRPYDMVQQNASFSQLVRLPVDLNALATDAARSLDASTELAPLSHRFSGDSRQLSDRLLALLDGQSGLCLATRDEGERLVLEVRTAGELPARPLDSLREAARDHGGAIEVESGRLRVILPAAP